MPTRRDLLEHSRLMRSRERTTILILSSVLVLLLIVLLVVFLRREELQIGSVEVVGTRVVSAQKVEDRVEEFLEGSRFFVIPLRNRFFVPRTEIKKALLEIFPEIETVHLSVGFGRTIRILISEYTPRYLSCMENECYFLTIDGFRYAPAPSFVNPPYVVFEGGTTTIRAHIVDPLWFTDVRVVIDGITLPVAEDRVIRVDLSVEGDAIATTQAGYELRWDDEISPLTAIERLEAVYDTADFAQALAAYPDTLEYIDARFGKKVFYKFTTLSDAVEE